MLGVDIEDEPPALVDLGRCWTAGGTRSTEVGFLGRRRRRRR